MKPIYIAPNEPCFGNGTPESPTRVAFIEDAFDPIETRLHLAPGTYQTRGRWAYTPPALLEIEGNGSTLGIVDPVIPEGRKDTGALHCGYCDISRLVIDGNGAWMKEGIFAQAGGLIERVTVYGLKSNLKEGLESFGILINGTSRTRVIDCGVSSTDEYSCGIYVGQIDPVQTSIVSGSVVTGCRIGFAVNERVTIRDCSAERVLYGIYNDTGPVTNVRVIDSDILSLYCGIALNSKIASGVMIRGCQFGFLGPGDHIGLEAIADVSDLTISETRFKSHEITLASMTGNIRNVSFNLNSLPERIKMNVRGNAKLSDIAFTGNRTLLGKLASLSAIPGAAQ